MAKKQLTLTPGLWRRVQGMIFEHVDSEKRVEFHESVDAICVPGPQFVCSGATKPQVKKPATKTAKSKPGNK